MLVIESARIRCTMGDAHSNVLTKDKIEQWCIDHSKDTGHNSYKITAKVSVNGYITDTRRTNTTN